MHVLVDPAILFFVFGVFAGALRSNLEIPPAVSKFLSLYLLMALGLKGGFALAASGLSFSVALSWTAAMAMALVVPLLGWRLLRRRIAPFDAAAVAATYGSVSAVTFVTATQYLEKVGIAAGGHMTVAMVLMESPAIIMAVVTANSLRQRSKASESQAPADDQVPPAGNPDTRRGMPLRGILHESFTDGAQLLLLGAMVVGYLSGEEGKAVMQPFSTDLFKGLLSFFLLDMGLMVARNFGQARTASPLLLAYGVVGPLVHAAVALALAALLGLPVADGALLMVLSASASYIVVPAVLRHAIPEANPALYFGLSLGVTLPLNILIGIPLYTAAAQAVLH